MLLPFFRSLLTPWASLMLHGRRVMLLPSRSLLTPWASLNLHGRRVILLPSVWSLLTPWVLDGLILHGRRVMLLPSFRSCHGRRVLAVLLLVAGVLHLSPPFYADPPPPFQTSVLQASASISANRQVQAGVQTGKRKHQCNRLAEAQQASASISANRQAQASAQQAR